jgi:mono/diheme cytochrome c family protein
MCRSPLLVVSGLLVLIAVAGCSKKEDQAKTYVIPQESRDIFAQRCSTCHGTTGKGDGPAAANLTPKPRNYTDSAWQAGVSDAHIREIIVKGGAAVGKSQLMPPNPDLENKPEVVEGLVGIVRGFKGK